MPWAAKAPSIVEAWLGGQAGAGAVADVIFGKVNPSGKLAETFPVRLEDTPSYLNFPGEAGESVYGERFYIGYRHYEARDIAPLYPFGHGLSYTTFEYRDLGVSPKQFSDTDTLEVTVTVANTGEVAGKEAVQLYVSDPVSSLQRPVKELKDFAKVSLAPGESRTIRFKLDGRDFSFYDASQARWIAESGDFEIAVGASSADIRLSQNVQLESTQELNYAFDEFTFFRILWEDEQTRPLLIERMPEWIGAFAAPDGPLENAVIPGYLLDQPLVKFPYFTGGEVSKEQIDALIESCNRMTYRP